MDQICLDPPRTSYSSPPPHPSDTLSTKHPPPPTGQKSVLWPTHPHPEDNFWNSPNLSTLLALSLSAVATGSVHPMRRSVCRFGYQSLSHCFSAPRRTHRLVNLAPLSLISLGLFLEDVAVRSRQICLIEVGQLFQHCLQLVPH